VRQLATVDRARSTASASPCAGWPSPRRTEGTTNRQAARMSRGPILRSQTCTGPVHTHTHTHTQTQHQINTVPSAETSGAPGRQGRGGGHLYCSHLFRDVELQCWINSVVLWSIGLHQHGERRASRVRLGADEHALCGPVQTRREGLAHTHGHCGCVVGEETDRRLLVLIPVMGSRTPVIGRITSTHVVATPTVNSSGSPNSTPKCCTSVHVRSGCRYVGVRELHQVSE
jgi:hypothetical protein